MSATLARKSTADDGMLSFLHDKQRFNVAISRAQVSFLLAHASAGVLPLYTSRVLTLLQSLIVVVGDPDALEMSENWRHWISFCKQNNSYRGYAADASGPSVALFTSLASPLVDDVDVEHDSEIASLTKRMVEMKVLGALARNEWEPSDLQGFREETDFRVMF